MNVFHLTYYSLSGCISHILLKNLFKNIIHITCGYEKLPTKIDEIYIQKDMRLISTNFSLEQNLYDSLFNLDNKFVYIDHHFNSKKLEKKGNKNIINTDFSSCWLVYKQFENYFKENKDSLRKLALLGTMYDMWNINKKEMFDISYKFNELFWKYNFNAFVQNFINGYREFNDEELEYLDEKIKDKCQRLKNLKRKEIAVKNAVLFVLNKSDYDLINDISLAYPQYDVYFIYLNDKKKLTIKHKLENCNMNELLEKIFKRRTDELSYSGDYKYGTLNYIQTSMDSFVNDLKIILDRM